MSNKKDSRTKRHFAIRSSFIEEEMPDPPTWEDKLKPAETLGRPAEKAVMANDSARQMAFGLLQHSFEMGQMPTTASFMGYAALQDISQNGLIRACIETVADDMTREFGKVECDDQERIDDVDKLNRAMQDFHIQEVLHEVAEKVGYFGGCLVYIDTGADDAEIQLPLNMTTAGSELGAGKLKGFRVIDPINVYPGPYNSSNPLAEDFYKPTTWYVMGRHVHGSRLIRFVANEVPQLFKPVYNFLGIAQAQILWDYVLHFNECRVAIANMAKKYSHTVLKTDMVNALFNAGGLGELDKRAKIIARYQDNNSITLIDKDAEDIVKIETPLGGLTDIGKQALEFLTAINRTPAVKLLGISPSGFNATGESDWRNYADHLASQQEKVFGAGQKRILDCIHLALFGAPNTAMRFVWNELGQSDEAAMANTQKLKADTAAVYLDRGVISPEEARQYIASDPDNDFSFIDPADVPETESQDFLDDVDKSGAVYGEDSKPGEGSKPFWKRFFS